MKIINIMATSLDGYIACHDGETDEERLHSGFIIPEDTEFVKKAVAECDAVIMGAKNLRACPELWDIKTSSGLYPKWCTLTTQGFDLDLPFWFQNQVDRYIFAPRPVTIPTGSTAVFHKVSPSCEAKEIYEFLEKLGCKNVILFGGGYLNQLFYEANLVDELKLTLVPRIIGIATAPKFLVPSLSKPTKMELLSARSSGSHMFLHYKIH